MYIDVFVCVNVCARTCAQLCPTLCDPVDCSLPSSSSIEFSRQECHWSGMSFPTPGNLPSPEPASLVSPALTGGFFTTAPSGKPSKMYLVVSKTI